VKKKAVAKKKSPVKKASKKKPASTQRSSAKKKSAKKQAAPKKKTGVKKKAVTKTPATTPAKKKKAVKSKPVAVKQPSAHARSQPPAGGSAKSKRAATKALNTNTRVRITQGHYIGSSGKIVRHDPYLGTYFVTFDAYKNQPAYQNVEWGPYFPPEFDIVK
jgi:hypothetical protein